jgi:hypothetical protein
VPPSWGELIAQKVLDHESEGSTIVTSRHSRRSERSATPLWRLLNQNIKRIKFLNRFVFISNKKFSRLFNNYEAGIEKFADTSVFDARRAKNFVYAK